MGSQTPSLPKQISSDEIEEDRKKYIEQVGNQGLGVFHDDSEYETNVDDQDADYFENSIYGEEARLEEVVEAAEMSDQPDERNNDEMSEHEREQLEAFRENNFIELTVELSDEQKSIIDIDSNSLLVIARAGSGKTRTLLHKAFSEIHKGSDKDQLLLLAFNRSAARQLNTIMHERYGIDNFESARTFHSLAYNLLGSPSERLISNGDAFLDERAAKVNLVKEVIRTRLSVKDKIKYWWYLSSLGKDREVKGDEARFLTLNGELVKSPWEKYIADFLFSCDIEYTYEPLFKWNAQPYRPDFFITRQDGKRIVIEHWGSNEESYLQQVQRKRAYWKSRSTDGYCLVETSMTDIEGDSDEEQRKSLTNALKSRLEHESVFCELLPEEIIAERSIQKTINILAGNITQFIDRAQVSHVSPQGVAIKAEEYKGQQRFFYQFAGRVYEEYLEHLREEDKIDFNIMMEEATDLINRTAGKCTLSFDHNSRTIPINNLKYIFVDEFQDFSQSYYEIVRAILNHNPGCKLWCVGDDWQAINQFAGSSTVYIRNFDHFFPGSTTAYLLTNHRSKSNVVELGNSLMLEYGKPAKFVDGNSGGENLYYMLQCKREESELDSYIRCAKGIVIQNPGKSIIFLARTKKILKRVYIDDFCHQLKQLLHRDGSEYKILDVKTIHSYKGKEADVVVLIDYNKWHYPLLHPERWRNEIFGENDQNVLDSERRLLYVAISRAKERLYFITNADDVPTEYRAISFGL